MLRISRTHYPVTALGPGSRLGVWLQGCPLACAGCMSLDTWDPRGGTGVPIDTLVDEWRAAIDAGAAGVTISGGEPLAQAAALNVLLVEIQKVRREAGARTGAEYDILLYTGFEPDELDAEQRRAAGRADVLVSGRYRAAEPTDLIWRGSANQRLHLQTALGRRRYSASVDLAPEHPPIQVRAEPDGFWVVGVPRRGTLSVLERQLRRGGVAVDAVSWRRG